jgi:hypothetical protein
MSSKKTIDKEELSKFIEESMPKDISTRVAWYIEERLDNPSPVCPRGVKGTLPGTPETVDAYRDLMYEAQWDHSRTLDKLFWLSEEIGEYIYKLKKYIEEAEEETPQDRPDLTPKGLWGEVQQCQKQLKKDAKIIAQLNEKVRNYEQAWQEMRGCVFMRYALDKNNRDNKFVACFLQEIEKVYNLNEED